MLIQIPFRLFQDKRFGRTDYKVYAFFYTNQDKETPPVREISKIINSNPDAIYDAISRLEQFDYIKKQVVTVDNKKIMTVLLLDL